MTRRLRKLFFAVLAVAMIFANTDLAIGGLVIFIPGSARWKTFIVITVVANVLAVIWYKLGSELVVVLGDCYLSLLRWARNPKVPKSASFFLGWGMKVLKPFNEWEETKTQIRTKIEAFLHNRKMMALSVLTWLIVPGSRSFTAIVFGMEKWPAALAGLLVINTLHVAFSFWFYAFIRAAVVSVYRLMF